MKVSDSAITAIACFGASFLSGEIFSALSALDDVVDFHWSLFTPYYLVLFCLGCITVAFGCAAVIAPPLVALGHITPFWRVK